jgi:hypothetical protein
LFLEEDMDEFEWLIDLQIAIMIVVGAVFMIIGGISMWTRRKNNVDSKHLDLLDMDDIQ